MRAVHVIRNVGVEGELPGSIPVRAKGTIFAIVYPMPINSITTRPFVEPRLECGSKRAGGRVLALSCQQVPASEFCRSVVVHEC